ncbi:MAG: Alkanesulfonates transporter ATP-binding protein / Sulfonate transporter, ATP-binding [Propionibacteriaceae bacterium]|nr:Alkanesulfonates transporter ATP-binding protein / Sulfonate transporter, ATP-binding [Propionibacteriaceae bacterium]
MEIDWSREWLTSLLWIARVFLFVLVGFVLVGWFLIRRTRWGRQFWRLSGMYFIPRGRTWLSWRPILTVALLLLLTVAAVRLDVVLSYQGNGMFTAMQELDAPAFWRFILIFGILATINVVLVLITYYIGQAQIIHWRLWLNQRMVGDWMSGAAYHRGRFVTTAVDNPDQRIQQDITSYTSDSQSLALGAVSSVVTLVSFTIILWSLSGPLTVFGLQIPRAMVFLAYLYVIIATVFAIRIGRPLIRLNFLNELLTASYRYALVRIRDNSENIAFYRGEQVENAGLMARFAAVIVNTWAIVFRSIKFQGFNLVISQIAVVFPIVIQARRFFSQEITLGDVTQTATAFGQVEGALSFFRLAYDDFASYRASLNRLTGLLDANEEARALPAPVIEEREAGLGIRDLDVRLPDGRSILTDLDLDIAGGQALVVKGPSGSGKTTLLRTLAGLWPYVEGTISRPGLEQVLFCAQQPYLPLGSLRTALAYPAPAESLADDVAVETLRSIQLGQLAERLDLEADWSKTLSPGEQQRLAFGRILIARPSLVFLDETTSALDEGMEHALYERVREQLPDCTLISVGHGGTLDRMHTNELTLVGDGTWETRTLVV